MNFQNKVAIITGASTGIGKATRAYLQQQGCTVYNLDIHAPVNEDPHFIPCDVAKKEDIYAAVDHVFAREKKIDHLFANAGVHLFANLEETSDEIGRAHV